MDFNHRLTQNVADTQSPKQGISFGRVGKKKPQGPQVTLLIQILHKQEKLEAPIFERLKYAQKQQNLYKWFLSWEAVDGSPQNHRRFGLEDKFILDFGILTLFCSMTSARSGGWSLDSPKSIKEKNAFDSCITSPNPGIASKYWQKACQILILNHFKPSLGLGKAEKIGIVQPEEEKLWADLIVALQGLKELTGNMERNYFQGMEGQDKGESIPME